jgi:hypothetical protein
MYLCKSHRGPQGRQILCVGRPVFMIEQYFEALECHSHIYLRKLPSCVPHLLSGSTGACVLWSRKMDPFVENYPSETLAAREFYYLMGPDGRVKTCFVDMRGSDAADDFNCEVDISSSYITLSTLYIAYKQKEP